ncbi:hypothetical protein GCM10010236_15720 [Streptomyces eurythermus]|nr:hypothetical protein GCM10010236_15720 [Streptomyces eurythermus]
MRAEWETSVRSRAMRATPSSPVAAVWSVRAMGAGLLRSDHGRNAPNIKKEGAWRGAFRKSGKTPDGYGRLRAMTMRWTWLVPS